MSKQTASPEKTATKQQTEPQPRVEALAKMVEFNTGSSFLQTKNLPHQLNDARFSKIHRQIFVGQIGEVHGNASTGHLGLDQAGEPIGVGFSGVRVHTGSEPHAFNEHLNAKAFTTW